MWTRRFLHLWCGEAGDEVLLWADLRSASFHVNPYASPFPLRMHPFAAACWSRPSVWPPVQGRRPAQQRGGPQVIEGWPPSPFPRLPRDIVNIQRTEVTASDRPWLRAPALKLPDKPDTSATDAIICCKDTISFIKKWLHEAFSWSTRGQYSCATMWWKRKDLV